MKLNELDIVFKVDILELEIFNKDKPRVWGNIDNDQLVAVVFDKMATYFPELSKVSPQFRNRVEQSIGLAFMRVNEAGQFNLPCFRDFLTCSQMSLTKKVVLNSYDEKMYREFFSMWIKEEAKLSH